jgi:hypothetical protein
MQFHCLKKTTGNKIKHYCLMIGRPNHHHNEDVNKNDWHYMMHHLTDDAPKPPNALWPLTWSNPNHFVPFVCAHWFHWCVSGPYLHWFHQCASGPSSYVSDYAQARYCSNHPLYEYLASLLHNQSKSIVWPKTMLV